ncbi:hypothetical protein HY991_04315 [Candidatus Micrarchaeota archaeon]|nr:hypothetical protein [Candidatus Micrarchaeota archaeon]
MDDFFGKAFDFLKSFFNPVTGYAAAGEACESDYSCNSGLYCSNGVCTAAKGVGEACNREAMCISRFCDAGVCCDASGKQTRSGCCKSQSDCYGDETCTDFVCVIKTNIPNGGYCMENSQCVSGHCDHSYCCDSGQCCPSDFYCPTGFKCTNYQCVSSTNLANGAACASASQCASGNCQNGVCCEAGKTCCSTQSECTSAGFLRCNEYSYCEAYTPNGGYCITGATCVSRNCGNSVCCESGKTCCSTNDQCANALGQAYTCGSNYYCVMTGQLKANGESCTRGGDCQSGNCYNSLCCEAGKTCCRDWRDCSFSQNCGPNYYCVEKTKKANGESCSTDYDCSSGHCGFSGSAYTVCCEAGKTCCTTNDHCPWSYVCDTGNHYCVYQTPTSLPRTTTTYYRTTSTTSMTTYSSTTTYYWTTTSTAYTTTSFRTTTTGACTCPANWLGDGACDSSCNTAACNYDNGDCRATTTTSRTTTTSGGCSCSPSWLGDGTCDSACNNAACNYDNGDCRTTTTLASTTSSRAVTTTTFSRSVTTTTSRILTTTSSSATTTTLSKTTPTPQYTTTTLRTTTPIVNKKADGENCQNGDECAGGYCVRGFCSAGPTYCGDNACDFGETYRTCPADCPAPPVKKEDGRYCEADSQCASDNCEVNVCCPAGKECCVFDSQCDGGYCGDSNYCLPLLAEGKTCSGYWECESKKCERGVCAKKAEKPAPKVVEPIEIKIVEEQKAVCGNANCEVHLGENCENCPTDCQIEGGCCSRDSYYVSPPFYTRGASEMRDSNEVGGVTPDHKAIFPHDAIKPGTSYTALIKDLGYTDYKVCCNKNVIGGDCCSDEDCMEGFHCRSNRCKAIPQCTKDEDCSKTQVCESGKCVKAKRTILFIPVNYENIERDSEQKKFFNDWVDTHAEELKRIYGEASCAPRFRVLKSYSNCKIEKSCSADVLDKITRCAIALGREYSDADYYVGFSADPLCDSARGWSTVGVGRALYTEFTSKYTTSHEFGHLLGLTDEYCWIDWPEAPEPQGSFDLDLEHVCGPNTPYPNPLSAEYGCDTTKPKSQGGCCDEWCSGTVHSMADLRAHKGTPCCTGNVYTNKEGRKGKSIMVNTAPNDPVVGLDEPSREWVDSILCG